MYYILKKNLLLRGWEKLPYALVDANTGQTLFIRGSEMDVLRLCDGSVDLSLAVIPQKLRYDSYIGKKWNHRGLSPRNVHAAGTGVSPVPGEIHTDSPLVDHR